MPNIRRFMIYLDPALLEQIKKIAKKNKRSANSEIVYALENYAEQQEKGERHDKSV